jgi:hypothetical protein
MQSNYFAEKTCHFFYPGPAGMAEKPPCVQCGKDAIGVQSFGCRFAYVCEDHAYSLLLSLKPGEKYSSGECCFERFGTTDT